MSQITATIRAINAQFFVTTEVDGTVKAVTTGINTIGAAVDQAKADTGAALQALGQTPIISRLITNSS